MSETLKDRLNSHSNAFEGLLSLIPAKVYYDEGTKEQWKRKKSSKAAAAAARKAKLDSGSSNTALDETQRRQSSVVSESSASNGMELEASDVTIIFDDEGNEIKIGHTGSTDDEREDEAEPTPASVSASSAPKNSSSTAQAPVKQQQKAHLAGEKAPSQTAQVNQSNDGTASVSGASQDVSTKAQDTPKTGPPTLKRKGLPLRDPAKVQELRQKIAEIVDAKRAQRRAPGSSAKNAPRSREELLAARNARKEAREQKRKAEIAAAKAEAKAKEEEKQSEEQQADAEESFIDINAYDDDEDENLNLMFGETKFKDGQKLDGHNSLTDGKKVKKRNAADQLKFIEQKKQKLNELSEEKQKDVAEKAKWSSAVLRSEGAHLKDDEKLLKKTVKRKLNQKLKSGREWRDRIDKVAKGIASREAKRDANLQARRENKGKRIKGKKKPAKKRAGF